MTNNTEWQGYVVDGTWQSADGTITKLSEMNEGYLVNVLCLLKRQTNELDEIWNLLPVNTSESRAIINIHRRKFTSMQEILDELTGRYEAKVR